MKGVHVMFGEGSRRHHRAGMFGRLMTVRSRRRVQRRTQRQDPLLRDCPTCTESVYILADRCRYCGAELTIPVEAA